MRAKYRFIVLLIIFFVSFISINLYSSSIKYSTIELDKISRYWEDRIAFQHIQTADSTSIESDDSLSTLLIIRDNKMYLIKDGYDDIKKVKRDSYVRSVDVGLLQSVWFNKVNSKPDYIKVTDRRAEKMLNVSEEYVNKNFGSFYTNVRNAFITKHVNIFKYLIANRVEAEMVVDRNPLISTNLHKKSDEPEKYSIKVTARDSSNGTLYCAEDADGDDVTETFSVDLSDGFSWGYESGPNIIYIYNNKEEDLKKLMGSLTHDAYYGTPEEEQVIIKTFPKDSEIIDEYDLNKAVDSAQKSSGSK